MNANPTTATVLNPKLNHRIERTEAGFALYDSFGYSGTFETEQKALARYREPQTNYNHVSNPDGI